MWSLAENVNPGRRCVHHADGLDCREGLSAFSSQLQAYRQQLPAGRKLVFGKLGGREDAPDGHLLRRLKILVKKASLGCGTCATCVAKTRCENWWLHKAEGRGGHWIIKLPSEEFPLVPEHEHSMMQFARAVGIDTAETGL